MIEISYSSPKETLIAVAATIAAVSGGFGIGAGAFAFVLAMKGNMPTELTLACGVALILAVLAFIRTRWGIGRGPAYIDPHLPNSSTIQRANQDAQLERWNNGNLS